MGSTNFNAPPLKMTMLTIGVVVALHVLTAMALVAIKPSTPVIEPPKVTPPIEIQMVTLPVESEQKALAIDSAEPVREIEPQPKSAIAAKPEPEIAKKSQTVTKTQPAVKAPVKSEPKKTTPKPKSQPNTSKGAEKEPFKHEIERQQSISITQVEALAAANERKISAAQVEKAAQQAHAKAMQEAQAASEAKAAREAQMLANANAHAKAKADQIAKAEAAAKLAQEADARNKAAAEEKAAAAASNTPVNFNASNANWAAKPSFSFPDRAKRGTSSGDTFDVVLVLQVNKQGGIDSVRLAQSSGNATLDREAQRQIRSGRFKPFTKNGVAVVGNVTLPISYAVP